MARLSTIITNTLLLLITLQIAPSLIKNIVRTYADLIEPKTKVGVIRIQGTLTDSTAYAQSLKKFFEQQDIKAIVLKMDCPGGCAGASQALFHEIIELKKIHMKPIVTWTQNICASGGYYIACATDYIITTPSAFVGSIGAFIPQPQLKKFIEQFNVKYMAITAGAYKTTGNPLLDLTPEQTALLKGLVDDTYRQFVTDVAQQRPKLTAGTADHWANGKIFTGAQAENIGLVDLTGSQITVERYLKNKIGVSTAIEWVRPTCKSRITKLFMGECDEDIDEQPSYLESFVHTVASCLEKYWITTIRS